MAAEYGKTAAAFKRFLKLSGNPEAAAMLTLADSVMILGRPPVMLTVAEAARALHINRSTVYQMCEEGTLKHSRFGTGRGTIRINAADLPSSSLDPPPKRHRRHTITLDDLRSI